MIGDIRSKGSLNAEIKAKANLSAQLSSRTILADVIIGRVVIKRTDYPFYDGEYIVTPKPDEEQVLETNEKVLQDDVHVLKIPYYDVANEYGRTIYIGGEVNA